MKDSIISKRYRLYSRRMVEGAVRRSETGTMTIGEEVEIGYIFRHTLMIDPKRDKAYKCHYKGAVTWDYHGRMRYAKGDFYIFQRVSDDWQNGYYYFVSWKDGKRQLLIRDEITEYYRSIMMAEDESTWEY